MRDPDAAPPLPRSEAMALSLDDAAEVFRQAMRDTVKRYSLWYLIQGVLLIAAGILAIITRFSPQQQLWCASCCTRSQVAFSASGTMACSRTVTGPIGSGSAASFSRLCRRCRTLIPAGIVTSLVRRQIRIPARVVAVGW